MTIESMTCKENGTKCEPLPFFWYETTVAEKSLSEITVTTNEARSGCNVVKDL